jgi:hypothetical protein
MRWCVALLSLSLSLQAIATPLPAVSKPSDTKAQATSAESGQQKVQPSKPAKKSGKPSVAAFQLVNSEVFSDAVATHVLADMRDGLESHLRRLMLSAFDADKMDGYLSFEAQVDSYFEKYDGFRLHYHVVQSTTVGSRGIALVDVDMTRVAREGTGVPSRHSSQIRFEMERGRKGWKIVDFRPREFFQ